MSQVKLRVKIAPVYTNSLNDKEGDPNLVQREQQAQLIQDVNLALKTLSKDQYKKFKKITNEIEKRDVILDIERNYLRKHGYDNETQHSTTSLLHKQQFAKQFFAVQQKLFDGLFMMGLIEEDPYKDKSLAQAELLKDYKIMIALSDCNLFDRLRLKLQFYYKSKLGRQQQSVDMDRLSANDFKLKLRHEKAREVQTLFTQLMFNYSKKFEKLDHDSKEPFETHFKLERSYDCGGPMRDTITGICNELMSDVLPILRPTANNQGNMEPETDCYQLNEYTKEPYNLRKMTFLGYFLGWSLQSIGSLNLEFPSAFWNRLFGGGPDYVYTINDVRSQDTLLANHLERIKEAAATSSEEDFSAVYGEHTFTLEGMIQENEKIVELCPSGEFQRLSKANAKQYISLYLKAYTNRDSIQFQALYQGLEDVASRKIMANISPQIAKRRICSSNIIDLDAFKASTNFGYNQSNYSDEMKKKCKDMFLQMIEEISNEDRQLVIKFMAGRSRLQPGVEQRIDFKVYNDSQGDGRLPIGHTCGNSMDVPTYSSVDVMKRQILIAVRLCGDIDDDGEYMDEEDMSDIGLDVEKADMQETVGDNPKALERGQTIKRDSPPPVDPQMLAVPISSQGVPRFADASARQVNNNSEGQNNGNDQQPSSMAAVEAMYEF